MYTQPSSAFKVAFDIDVVADQYFKCNLVSKSNRCCAWHNNLRYCTYPLCEFEQMLAGFEPAPASAFSAYWVCKLFVGYYLLLC